MTTRTCTKCSEEKQLTQFYKKVGGRDGLTAHCKECLCKKSSERYHQDPQKAQESSKNYARRNSDKVNAKNRAWCKANPSVTRDYSLRKAYGITLEDYNKMFSEQNGCCAICKRHQSEFKRPLFVDHCHSTGRVRGLLCSGCNSGIGMFEDSKEFLQSAIGYLS